VQIIAEVLFSKTPPTHQSAIKVLTTSWTSNSVRNIVREVCVSLRTSLMDLQTPLQKSVQRSAQNYLWITTLFFVSKLHLCDVRIVCLSLV